jgi:hypothetical protein
LGGDLPVRKARRRHPAGGAAHRRAQPGAHTPPIRPLEDAVKRLVEALGWEGVLLFGMQVVAVMAAFGYVVARLLGA